MVGRCALRERPRKQVAAARSSEMIFSWIRHFALACCSRMILSENRHPSRIKFGTGFFRIMLWRERHNAAFTINEEQSAVALADCGRSAIRTDKSALPHHAAVFSW
jgi:hypothetical protein